MDYYYDQEKETKEKEIYEKAYNKIVKNSNKMVFIIFGIIGAIFALIGLFLIYFKIEDEGFLMGIPFLIMGIFFVFLGILIRITSSKIPDYDKYKKRIEKYAGSYGSYDYLIRIEMLEEKNKILEQRIEELERRR